MAKIIFFGTPFYVVCVPEELKNAGHEIVAVLTQSPKPIGRKQIITPSPIENWAKENNIKVLYDLNIPELENQGADVGVLASYGKIVGKEVLDVFPKRVINIHPSLLPRWRGACPIPEQILAGESEIGISLMLMDEKMDTGPVLSQDTIPASLSDTQQSLLIKAFQKGAEILVDTLPRYLSGELTPKPQDNKGATYTYKTAESKEKAYFDIHNPPTAEELDRMIRAFYPWPNAWTKWNGKIVKLYPERMIQMEGKNPVDWETFKRAYPDFPISLSQ